MNNRLPDRCGRLAAAGLLAFALSAQAAETSSRPRVGLVLGGGGAR
ncbi:MAG: hypothetical protein H6R03_1404, partial [Burkholderiaceae bacterium]|nr:hypothetical protein [Burkholderiaceae bacterium]